MSQENPPMQTANIQQAILAALRGGATLATSHKEGGTRIFFAKSLILAGDAGRFYREDFGESDLREVFEDEAEFLVFLARFFAAQARFEGAADASTEETIWQFIFDRLQPPR